MALPFVLPVLILVVSCGKDSPSAGSASGEEVYRDTAFYVRGLAFDRTGSLWAGTLWRRSLTHAGKMCASCAIPFWMTFRSMRSGPASIRGHNSPGLKSLYGEVGKSFVEREPVFWLLPYWMGRCMGMISAPSGK